MDAGQIARMGIRPINNVVDITNFVLQEMGQPLHAYDTSAISGNKIRVLKPPRRHTIHYPRRKRSENWTQTDLMICDAKAYRSASRAYSAALNSGIIRRAPASFWRAPGSTRRISAEHPSVTDFEPKRPYILKKGWIFPGRCMR